MRKVDRACPVMHVAAATVLAASSVSFAATWNSTSSANSSWTVATNWQSSSIPGNLSAGATSNADVANFGNATGKTVYWDGGRTLQQLNFTNTSGSYSVQGNSGAKLYLYSPSTGIVLLSNATGVTSPNSINGDIVLTGAVVGGFSQTGVFTNTATDPNGTLLISGTISSAATLNTGMQLKGTNTGANTIASTISNGTAPRFDITLPGTGSGGGTWILSGLNTYTGKTTITQSTLVAGRDVPASGAGAFGSPTSGNATLTVGGSGQGNVALLAGVGATGYEIARAITVNVTPVAYTVSLGGYNTGGVSTFSGAITLNNPVTLRAAAGGTAAFTGAWTTNNNVITIGSSGNTGTVILNSALASTGGVRVNAGTLTLGDVLTGALNLDSGSTLSGSGKVVGTVGGAGLISPGNSPGILTATQLDTAGGQDYAFEFAMTGTPDYADATTSRNDVLRLTDLASPFTSSLSSGNVVSIYFGVADLEGGDTFRGAFYTDKASGFADSLKDATINYYVKGDGNGTNLFNGAYYYDLATFRQGAYVSVATVAESAPFAGGAANGYVTEFVVMVPEPGAMFMLGMASLLAVSRRRQHHAGR